MVEIMVAMVLLVIGVLAMLVIVEGGLTSTNRTTAREQATNLAREVVERSREIPYSLTTASAAPAAIANVMPEHPTATGTSFVVRRRNIDYTVNVRACSIDDPADGAGVGNTTFCDNPGASTGPGSNPGGSGLAAGFNVLGVPVSLAADGKLLTTVCNIAGTDSAIGNQVGAAASRVLSLTGNGAQVLVCPSGYPGSVGYDVTPDDLRRVRVTIDWTQANDPYSLTQTTLLTTPA